ncbi:aldehyde dehydrogenase family protein [Trinickia acidisoli]|uniref:aldehyde dehydrogenase family protein n=1 Tax=Trinickia acidisoli TaxID=2767482 RepID=UPI001A8C40BA|nr:aldehyde dehydrogenase family protein [Trinickia acidisoli]
MKMYVAGEWSEGHGVFEVRNPENLDILDVVPFASDSDVERAIDFAHNVGAPAARRVPTYRRADVLRSVSILLEERFDSFATSIASEGIKTIKEARREVTRAIQTLSFCADHAGAVGHDSITFDRQPHGSGRTGYVMREPIGVVLAITPFNDPLNLVAHKVGPAIASGNAVLLKPHSATPLTSLMLAQCFEEAGLPAGQLQVLTGPGRTVGSAMVSDERINMITFTGGYATGTSIAKAAGVKKLAMELGSNAATILLRDADLSLAIPDCLSGAYWAAGQNCLHVQRLIVETPIYEEVRERFVDGSRHIVTGSKLDETTDMGPLINRAAIERVNQMVYAATERGARVLTGGEHAGSFYRPTVIENTRSDDSLCREEVYGPVTVIQRADDFDHAIHLANDSHYGLQAGIFTKNLDYALRASTDLKCGTVVINGSTDFRVDTAPFGGRNRSGIGREGVEASVREMSETKVVCFNTGTD